MVISDPSLSDYQRGEALLPVKADSAFYFFNKVTTTAKDSVLIAVAYSNMSIIQNNAGDYYGSQESISQSMRLLNNSKLGDRDYLASNYNELGNSYLNLRDFSTALKFYDSAIATVSSTSYKLTLQNNKGVGLQKSRNYVDAISLYEQILPQAQNENAGEYARVLSNLAKVRWLADKNYYAAPIMLQALQIRKDNPDEWGLNASYSHLADFYQDRHPDSALLFATKMYHVAYSLNSPDDELEALQKLIKLHSYDSSRYYFTKFEILNDSIQTARAAARNQFAYIRFQVEKNRSENLVLQRDNGDKTVHIIKQRIIIYLTIVAAISLLIFFRIRFKRRQARAAHLNKEEIQRSRLQTSQKVHDVVANGLYRVMSELEHTEIINKDKLLDQIEVLYEQSRDISYEPVQQNGLSFSTEVHSLLLAFADINTKVLVVGNDPIMWQQVAIAKKKELLYVLQEMMVNMKKHSNANNVAINFKLSDKTLSIHYADDGVGIKPDFDFGNGLTNTENRIQRIGGSIKFEAKSEKGFIIDVSCPI